MLKELFQYEREKLLKLIFVHVRFLIVFCLLLGMDLFCSYQGGSKATQDNSYFGIRFWLMVPSFLVFCVCLLIYIVMIFRIGPKYIFPSIAITLASLIIFVFTMRQISPMMSPAKGYYDYVRSNVDINEIHNWLVNYEAPDYEFVREDETQKAKLIDREDWPECIKALNPTSSVLIREVEGIKYVAIYYAVDWEMRIGLCVTEKPIYGPEFTERRMMLCENAFVFSVD